jgi:hypothetical protein
MFSATAGLGFPALQIFTQSRRGGLKSCFLNVFFHLRQEKRGKMGGNGLNPMKNRKGRTG